ncbi:MAG: ATP-binding protein [Nitrospirota bacterium]
MKMPFLHRWPPPLPLNLKFIIGCSLTLIIALGISFSIIARRQEQLIMKQIENEARIVFKQIVLTRSWIADHGGIFIEKLPWVKPSPFLEKPEIVDMKGKRYVKETPAMVTKELSNYAKDRGFYWFHITSLTLTNPSNAPDEFEKGALQQFERSSIEEIISIETIDRSKYLRYIAPLYVEEACLGCHTHQGYKVGDVRGAISVTIPMDKTLAEIAANKKRMLIAALLTVLALMSAMFLMMRNLVLTPMRRLKSAITEFSEGRYNPARRLRTGDEFEDLCTAFSEMARSLTEYHHSLNDKIRAATEDLEETNKKLLEANRLLNESNIRKSDFIARASHELRTPLTSIKGAMDYIAARLSAIPQEKIAGTSFEDLSVFFEVIKKNAERLIRMVTTMLDLERIEMGVAEFNYTAANLSSLIVETMTSLQVNADEKSIIFYADLPNALPVYADEDKIKQVLVNLLSNAIKFSPEGSEITIHASIEHDYVLTKLCDSGPGVPEAEQEKIFEKFYKRDSKEGTGLGLAICKSIIEAHRGTIGVVSDGRKGSCFYFELPCLKGGRGCGTQENDGDKAHHPTQKGNIVSAPC